MAVDPWSAERRRAEAELAAAEAVIEKAVRAAIDQWLTEVRRLVLGPDETLTAAGLALVEWARATGNGGRLEPRTITAAGDMPNLEGFGQADPVWLAALRALFRPAILDLFTERFMAFARGAIIAAQPYRDAFINQVFSRLRLFPAQEFEVIRFEIAEAISEGEGIDQIRDRVAAQLDFDTTRGAQGEQSASRGVQGRIDEVEKLLDADDAATDPDDPARLSAGERAALRKERGELYREKRRLDQKWEYKARRIARTEAAAALNGGDYSGALASEEIEGITLWKQWLATTDERTRHSHVLADGQVQKLRDPFVVGGWPLEHPADPVGPAHEVINCRCTALYHDADDLEAEGFDPEDLPAPEGDPLVSPEEMMANASRSAARIEAMADMNAAAVPVGGEMAETLPNGWRGVLAPLDIKSGDGRIIATPQTLRVREAPRSLLWQPELSDYHGGAVVVGRIDRVWEENGLLMGEGPFDLGDEMAQKAARQLGEGYSNGVSVDLDDFTMVEVWQYADGTPIPDDVMEIADWDELWEEGARPISMMTDWRLMAATLVPQPAFNEARLVPVYDYTPADDADLPPGVTAPAADEGAELVDAVAAASLPAGRVLVAAVSGDTGLPVAPADTPWDPEGATERIFARFTDEAGEVDTAAVASAYLWVDEDTDPAMPEAYWIGFADWLEDADGNGALTTIPAGAQAAADYVVTGLDASTPEADVTALRAAVCSLYDSIRAVDPEWPECPTSEDLAADEAPAEDMAAAAAPRPRARPATRAGRAAVKGARRTANRTAGRRSAPARPGVMTIVAAAAPAYAAADFADPGLTGPTPLTVSDDGHVKGHLAIFGTCHTSFPDVCVTPPRTQTGYAMFHLGEVQTDAGPIGVGKITLGTGHAAARAGARPAAEHYDHTGTCVAVVRAGEDEHGIWVAGRLVEDVTPERLAALRRSPLSGDWRRVNGNLELVAALAVNAPGFPVPRTMVASAGGSQLSLVAAGVVPRPKQKAKRLKALDLTPAEFARQVITEQRKFARRGREADQLAARLGLDHATQAEALAARIGVGV
jgi:hypothetical protein